MFLLMQMIPLAEDLCFLWQYLKSCPENNMILHTNEKLYHYMPTKGSLSSLKLGKKFNEKRLVVLNRTDKMIEECKIFTGGGYSHRNYQIVAIFNFGAIPI